MNWRQRIEENTCSERIAPEWDTTGIPVCSDEKCPQYDGKRCRALGFQPSRICEPAVMEMAQMLTDFSSNEHEGHPSVSVFSVLRDAGYMKPSQEEKR